jgi:hypothetical protein
MVRLAAPWVKQGMPVGMITLRFRRWWKRTGLVGVTILLYSMMDFAVDWLSGSKSKDIAQAALNVRSVLEHAPLDTSNARLYLLIVGVVLLGITLVFTILDRFPRDRWRRNETASLATESNPTAARPPVVLPGKVVLPDKRPSGAVPFVCPTCDGTGKLQGTKKGPCDQCDALGYRWTFRSGRHPCRECDGSGKHEYLPWCGTCRGDGFHPFPFMEDQPPVNESNLREAEERYERRQRQRKRDAFRQKWGVPFSVLAFSLLLLTCVIGYLLFSLFAIGAR